MNRMPEPELMNDAQSALAYASADLSELQQAMVTYFVERCERFAAGRLLDLGCGAADMTIRFARAFPALTAVGVDGAEAMLACGARAVKAAALDTRIRLECRRLPDPTLSEHAFDAVIANSLLHHLADPLILWRTAVRCAKPGAAVMVMDLRRPADVEAAGRLVEAHAAEASPVLRQDFLSSLCAAYTAMEIRGQLAEAGLRRFQVEEMGDLHVLAWGVAAKASDCEHGAVS
jgi:ubiquinone/menaquinone biosynthesis C-methylase UbiE